MIFVEFVRILGLRRHQKLCSHVLTLLSNASTFWLQKKNSPNTNTIPKTNWDVFFSKLTMFWNSDFSPLTILKKMNHLAGKLKLPFNVHEQNKTSFKNQPNKQSQQLSFKKKMLRIHPIIFQWTLKNPTIKKKNSRSSPHLTPPPATRWACACDAAAAAAASPVLRRRARRRGRRTSSCRSRSRAWRPAPWHQ